MQASRPCAPRVFCILDSYVVHDALFDVPDDLNRNTSSVLGAICDAHPVGCHCAAPLLLLNTEQH